MKKVFVLISIVYIFMFSFLATIYAKDKIEYNHEEVVDAYLEKILDYNNWKFEIADNGELKFAIKVGKYSEDGDKDHDLFFSGEKLDDMAFWVRKKCGNDVCLTDATSLTSGSVQNETEYNKVGQGWTHKSKDKYTKDEEFIFRSYFSKENSEQIVLADANDIEIEVQIGNKQGTTNLKENFFKRYYDSVNKEVKNPEGGQNNPRIIEFENYGDIQEFDTTCVNGTYWIRVKIPKNFGQFTIEYKGENEQKYIQLSNDTKFASYITENQNYSTNSSVAECDSINSSSENTRFAFSYEIKNKDTGVVSSNSYYTVECGASFKFTFVTDEKMKTCSIRSEKDLSNIHGDNVENSWITRPMTGDGASSYEDRTYETYKPVCGIFKPKESGGKLLPIVQNLYKILKIAIPLLVAVLTIIEFFKVLFSGEDKTMKDAFQATVKRFILIIVIIFLPILIEFIIRIAGLSENCLQEFL